MPGEEIITIVNNSGKIISTGRQLMGIFKDAKATYRERKEAAKAERDFNNGSYSSGRSRGEVHITVPRGGRGYDEYDSRGPVKKLDGGNIRDRKLLGDSNGGRRKSHDDDTRSFASKHTSASRSKSHRGKRSSSQAPTPSTALTVDNLKTYTEISSTAPSKPPKGYSKDLELAGGRPTLNHANTMPASPTFDVAASGSRSRNPFNRRQSEAPPSSSRNRSSRDRDHDLAYGDLPPDLHLRDDLDRGRHRSSYDNINRSYPVPPPGIPTFAPDFSPQEPEQKEALDLISRIESFLLEAHCLQASASCMIENLQQNPEAAAAVALSLAELSAIIGKMSPAFLAFLKGGSPAIYALLCSPQFLIGTGIAAGVMVVMFGGWKIIRKITQGNAKQKEAAVEMNAVSGNGATNGNGMGMGAMGFNAGARAGAAAGGHDDALVLDDDLSTIECWRRGIVVTGEEEAEVELRSPEADKALRQKYKDEVQVHGEVSPDDSVSQVGLARRTTVKKEKEYRPSGLRERLRDAVGGHSSSDKSDKERDAKEKEKERDSKDKSSSRRHRDDLDIPDRKSSRDKKDKAVTSSSEVGASSQVSYRSSRSHRTSTRSEAGGGSRSKLDREREKDTKDRERKSASRVGTSSSKEVNLDDGDSAGKKKSNMIKSLFKKMKDKEDEKIATKEREERRDRDRERERERERDGGKERDGKDRERERERRTSKEGHGERHVRRAASVAN
ncbi:hypothetical protein SMACR_07735 [Sordaria macrospora]|uniref:WGS project CABT00000000 data, contig 2.47 n=2 Tax=Sordaria macrospora TaxID=5147 RepID=F7W8V6_SORMK|nr:uncharacterized protein SMAC_07735 [Sordaria macrospora k-hell]KAA8630726.1 hypothetical protein SMACR_07735 [Sordaria macrospora]WPJ66404.1 hypothetical protein SMAC4_07735 [Sordaria macrospora]CCC05079.1 unnamed protein product [Sordaria macrospora k-hell]